MIASDLADLYVNAPGGESFEAAADVIGRAFRQLGWRGSVRRGPAPPSALPVMAPPCHPVLLDPLPDAQVLAAGVRALLGAGRLVRLPWLDVNLLHWRLDGGERGYALRGFTMHDVMDPSVAMTGSLFAIVGGAPPSTLYFGTAGQFIDLIRMQGPTSRATVLVCERVELTRRADGPAGTSLLGTIDLDRAPTDAVIVVVSQPRATVRVVPDAFPDVATARLALDASNVHDVVLFARIVARDWLD